MWKMRYIVLSLVILLMLAPVFAGEWSGPAQKLPIRYKGGLGVAVPINHSPVSRQHTVTSSTSLHLFASQFWEKGKLSEWTAHQFEQQLKGKVVQLAGRVSPGNIYPRFMVEIRDKGLSYQITAMLQGDALAHAIDLKTGSLATIRGRVIGYYVDEDDVLTFRLDDASLVE